MPEQSSQIPSEASTFRKLKAHGPNSIIESKQKRYQKRSRHLPILNFHNEYLNFMKLSSKQSKKGGI